MRTELPFGLRTDSINPESSSGRVHSWQNQSLNQIDLEFHHSVPLSGMLDRLAYRLEPQPTARPIDLVRVATGFEPIRLASIGESFLPRRRHRHIDARSLEHSHGQRRGEYHATYFVLGDRFDGNTEPARVFDGYWSHRLDRRIPYKTSECCIIDVRIAQRGVKTDDSTDGHSGRRL